MQNFRSDIWPFSSFLSNRRLQVVLDGMSSQEYPVHSWVPQGSIHPPAFFLLYINDLPDDVICDLALCWKYCKGDLWQHLICGNNLNWPLNLNLIYETLDWGRKWLVDCDSRKTELVSLDWSNNTGANDGTKDGSVKMLGLTFSTKLNWGFCIISINKTASKKIWALICAKVALYLYKFTIRPWMEYFCHVLFLASLPGDAKQKLVRMG